MSLRIRFQGPSGSTFGFSIERLSDGSLYDFGNATFSLSPTTLFLALPENTPSLPGQYKYTLSPTPPTQFTDGDYAVTIFDQVANVVAGQLAVVMHSGDDATQIPGGPVASVTAPVTVGANHDKSGYSLNQAFPANFGALAINSGGAVTAGSVADKTGYSLTQAFPANFASLNIATSGSITVGSYATGLDPGSLVLTSPANKLATDGSGRVTVGTVADKTGYSIAPNGLDSITIEQGINARQALSPILAASAGVVTGAGTGTILIRGANVTTSRITASTDNAGNRSSVTLTLPT